MADHTDWQVEVAHPTPAGNLIPDGVVLRWPTTTLPRLTKDGASKAVWRVVGNRRGEERHTLTALPKAR
ncbi:hypothetical protein [Streptomyces sp. NBC_00690]|uniref:hypothetical protein n=1 Tax=Streptomyces sp. NBC_00690 TaxID=2975808 RepID=UPI002E27E889|nr:hypothetical protein [Streptomyces sp. NBC_00690]